jgi:ketosteroid isomerase-like protein
MRALRALWFAFFAACNAAAPSKAGLDVQQVTRQLDSLDARFNAWIAAGQVDSIVGVYYAPEATLLVAGTGPVQGREQIRAVYESFYKLGNVRGRIQRSDLRVADSVATDIGHYDLRIIGKPDTAKVVMSDRGSYITSFVRRNGQWQAIYDSNVSEVPPAASTTPNSPKK